MKDNNSWKRSVKAMESHRNNIMAERQVLIFKKEGIDQQLQLCNKQLNEVEKHIRLHKKKQLTVSDHAIIRYQERIEVIDPALVADKILTPQLRNMVETLGNGVFPVDDFRVVVQDNTVITVIK